MGRRTYMAWADTLDPNDLGAAQKAVTVAYVPGTEIAVPQNTKSIALDLIVGVAGPTVDLFMKIESSRNKQYWADFTGYDDMTLVGNEVQASARTLVIKVPSIVDGMSKHLRYDIKESDFLRFSFRGDAAGATIWMTATFFEEDA